MNELKTPEPPVVPGDEPKSFFGIIIHSFFVIPFFIAVTAIIFFALAYWLTHEKLTAFDYLEQVKTAGSNKRWQSAFELSKILANPRMIPADKSFFSALENAFINSANDDPRVLQYLALAMAKSGHIEFEKPLLIQLRKIENTDPQTASFIIYALGSLKSKLAVDDLLNILVNPQARLRSMSAAALGTIADPIAIPSLEQALHDPEPNVQWTAAIGLGYMKVSRSQDMLLKMSGREYWKNFEHVDSLTQTQIRIQAIQAISQLPKDHWINTIKKIADTEENLKVRAQAQKVLEK